MILQSNSSRRGANIRILHCIPSLGGGGAERQLAYLGAAMAEHGVEMHIAYLHDGPNTERLQRSAAILHKIECSGNHDPRILMKLWRIARDCRPHLLQTWLPQMDIAGALVGRALGTPVILSERSCELAYVGGWKNWLRRLLGRRAAAIIANSEGGRAYWLKQGYRGRATVIRNAIPTCEIASTQLPPAAASIDAEVPVVLYAGRFSAEKNLNVLVRALELVLCRFPTAIVFLFGEGPLKQEIAALCAAQEKCAPRIRLAGYTDALAGWLRRANVFVSVSHFEGNPNTVLEAAASRCPLVLSDIPAHREFLDNKSAWFVPTDSVHAIADAVIDVLTHRQLVQDRTTRAHSAVASLGIAAITSAYAAFCAELVNAPTLKLGAT